MRTLKRFSRSLHWFFIIAVVAAGCTARSQTDETNAVTDQPYLTGSLWDDGQAEIAFYAVDRNVDHEGQPDQQQFTMGTYLVKHDFDTEAMTKATGDAEGVPSFKFAQFFEFNSGSYQYKYNYVTNARQRDLRPIKDSFSSFDWCSNQYRELAFQENGTVRRLMRSDDYGNASGEFSYQQNAYPPAEIPLVVRGLDFSDSSTQTFTVIQGNGQYVDVEAEHVGTDSVQTQAGTREGEEIVLRYAEPISAPVAGQESETQETYWRGTGEGRVLLKMESQNGRYSMDLIEHLRSPYWEENIFENLDRISDRP